MTSRRLRRTRIGLRAPAWMLLPAIVLFTLVVLWPSARGAIYSFTDWNGITENFAWVGFDNFVRIFTNDRAGGAIGNTLVFALIVTVGQNVLGLLLALGLNAKVRSRNVLRVIFFTPVVLTPIVCGYIWSYLLSPLGGINSGLRAIGLGGLAHDWLGDPKTAMVAVCVAVIWQFSGYSMVIFLAGLQAVPNDVIEAAVVDGAGPVRRLVSVILPLLNGAIAINLLLSLISGLSQFDQVYVMTGGGPARATETVATAIYKTGFLQGDYPYGNALSLVMSLIVASVAILQFRLTSRQVER